MSRFPRSVGRAALAVAALVAAGVVAAGMVFADSEPGESVALAAPAEFEGIADESARSTALFEEIGKVLVHPRCVNCHPSGDSPLQGEDGRVHEPPVVRGAGGMGAVGMRCTTCHTRENFDPAGVPGAPHWRLAPRGMAWEGLTPGEICRQLVDSERNGGRTLDELAEHFGEDELVGWGWEPGADRQPAPGTQAELGALVRAWIETGAVCPE